MIIRQNFTKCVQSSYHEVSDPEAELVNQQQREVDHLSAILRATRTDRKKASFKHTDAGPGQIPYLQPGGVARRVGTNIILRSRFA